jgi:hypothetical protein
LQVEVARKENINEELNSLVVERNEDILVLKERVESGDEELLRRQACIQDLERSIEQGLDVKNQDIERLNGVCLQGF